MLQVFFHQQQQQQQQKQQQQQQHPQLGRVMQHRKGLGNKIDPWKGASGGCVMDFTLCLSDELISRILRILPLSPYPYSEVCKRWLKLQGLLRKSIKVIDWKFLQSGRMSHRFPNLTDIDLTVACLSSTISRNPNFSDVFLTHGCLSIQLDEDTFDPPSVKRFIQEQQILPTTLDKGLMILADAFPDLQRLCVVDVRTPETDGSYLDASIYGDLTSDGRKEGEQVPADERDDARSGDNVIDLKVSKQDSKAGKNYDHGLSYVAQKCPTLQELELHHCTDESLDAISLCRNLQIVRLIGSIGEYYHCVITDIGLTILARNCSRLVKLDLSGCEGGYDGMAAIGQCCVMLEELTISHHMFYDGWLAGLSFCSCLKTLRLENCKQIDPAPGPIEHLGYCMALEHLQLVRCNLRDEAGFQALMMLCVNIQELEIEDCWGLDDEIFCFAAICRRVKLLSLEGCSPLTTAGLETVLLAYRELQALRVVYCNNIKDVEISPDLALQFCNMKELKWRPDAKSFLYSRLAGTGIGQQGGKFFKKMIPN